MRAFPVFAWLLAGLYFCSAGSASAKVVDPWAACIWHRAPESATNWLDKFPVKKNTGWGDGTPAKHLQMRIIAACFDVKSPKIPLYIGSTEAGLLQNILRSARPKVAFPADLEARDTFYCSVFFEDDADGKFPAGYDYGYGTDTSKAQIASSRSGYGMTFGREQAMALLRERKLDAAAVNSAISNSPDKVKNYHPALASGRPFIIAEGAGIRNCKFIQSDGTLTNA